MTKLLLCSISMMVLTVCNSNVVFADSLTDLVDKPNTAQTQASGQKTLSKTTYVRKALEGKTPTIKKEDTSYTSLLSEAVALHNFIKLIDEQIDQAATFKLAAQEKELDKAIAADFDSCQINSLSDYFSSPKTVWETLKKETDDRVEKYGRNLVAEAENIDNNSAKVLANTGAEVSTDVQAVSDDGSDIKDSDIADLAIEWQIGYNVLNSFYSNQDAWGDRKTSATSSLPTWTDQKYLYNEKTWKPKYRQIVEHCEKQSIGENPVRLTLKEPNVSDAYKYDYYFYNNVKKAHNNFIVATEAKGCILTSDMKKAPDVAPRPLPPVDENIMILTGSDGQFTGLYPQNPQNPSQNQNGKVMGEFLPGTLWEAYKAEGYRDVAPKGEFDTYFKVSGSSLSPKQATKEIKANRLSKYLELKANSKNSEKIYQTSLENAADKLAPSIKKFAEKYKVVLPENLNYLDEDDLKTVRKAFLTQQNELVKAAQAKMGEKAQKIKSMTTAELKEDKDLAFLNALKKDKDVLVTLTRETAMSIDDAIKEEAANKKLKSLTLKNSLAEKENSLKQKNYKFNRNACMRTTNKAVLDLKSVKIK